MRRLASLTLASALVILCLVTTSRSQAQSTCACPWEVKQLTCSGISDCALQEHNCLQNVGFWANQACWNRGGACTYVSTPLGCTTNPDGTTTYSVLINYKCNQC